MIVIEARGHGLPFSAAAVISAARARRTTTSTSFRFGAENERVALGNPCVDFSEAVCACFHFDNAVGPEDRAAYVAGVATAGRAAKWNPFGTEAAILEQAHDGALSLLPFGGDDARLAISLARLRLFGHCSDRFLSREQAKFAPPRPTAGFRMFGPWRVTQPPEREKARRRLYARRPFQRQLKPDRGPKPTLRTDHKGHAVQTDGREVHRPALPSIRALRL